jgi:hypothetical protein
VVVHVPPGFDGTRRPGVVLYFHGWNGCADNALASSDMPCVDGGDPRPSADLAEQIDRAHVNALLVAVELRVDLPSGEPGQLAMPGGLRDLLRELFASRLNDRLGCALAVDALDRVVMIAHSGGYQAAASALLYGDVPQITEVDLLDALYGADDVFSRWVSDVVDDPAARLRFVDLYTSAGGTRDRSRQLAALARERLGRSESEDPGDGPLYDDDRERELPESALASPIVFQRVPHEHSSLPRAYVTLLLQGAGFAPIAGE